MRGRALFFLGLASLLCVLWIFFGTRSPKILEEEPQCLNAAAIALPERRKYMDLMRDMVFETLVSLQNRTIPPRGTGVPKIAFMFTIDTDLTALAVWEKFFDGWPVDRYSIYVHSSSGNTFDTLPLPLAKHGARLVPVVRNAWEAMFGVEVAGYHIMLQDPDTVQMIVIENQALPLKAFGYIYHYLVELSPQTSKFCLASPSDHALVRDNVLSGLILWTGCLFRDYNSRFDPRVRKHHQMKVVSREHAGIIIRRAMHAYDVWYNAAMQAAPDWSQSSEGTSNEAPALVALLLELQARGSASGDYNLDLLRIGVEQNCVGFVHWRRCFVGTKFDLENNWEVVKKLIGTLWFLSVLRNGWWVPKGDEFHEAINGFPRRLDELRDVDFLGELVQSGFLFARKFRNGSPAEEVLPTLWGKVNESKALASVWSRNDASGEPRPQSER